MRLVLAVLVAVSFATCLRAEPVTRDRLWVVDGDTIYVQGQKKNTRLNGFNAPETGSRAQCEDEKVLGKLARERLLELRDEGRLDITFIPCSCPPGTEGTKACNFERSCGVLTSNGVDVGKTLIAEELAVPFVCGETSCPPIPRPWCR